MSYLKGFAGALLALALCHLGNVAYQDHRTVAELRLWVIQVTANQQKAPPKVDE